MRLAFLTPAPDFPEPWRWAFDAEAQALIDGSVEVDPIPWTEAGDLAGYDLVLPLVTWGYHLRYAEWLRFLDRLEQERLPVINPPALLRWNSHKRYLAELGAKGIPAVPTITVEACQPQHLDHAREQFGTDRLVIKPPVSGGAFGTHLLTGAEPLPPEAAGQPMILQPYLETVATAGEYSLLLFDNRLSHSVVKRPRPGDFRVQPHFGGETAACDPPPGSEELAAAALSAAPAKATYARVDIIPDVDGTLRIMELELVEPALFLHLAPDGGGALTRAIRSAAERASE